MTDSPLALTPEKLELLVGDETAPWHQLPDEPDDAFEAFFFWRSLLPGKRSREKAYRQMLMVRNPERLAAYKGRAAVPRDWAFWETAFDWPARSRAFDDHVRRALMGAEADYLEEMLTRHKSSLIELQKKGMAHIRLEGFETSAAALRAVHISMQMERDSAGLPDVAHLLTMTSEQLKAEYQVTIAKLSMSFTVVDDAE